MHFGTFQLQGFSLGGIETCVVVLEWSLAIDVGRGRRPALRCDHLALTHTHMDHAGGIVYLLALRQLYRMRPPTVYVPAQQADALQQMIAAWDKLQRFTSHYTLVPVSAGERYPLRRGLELVPFRTHHPVPSFGYTVVHTVEKLRPEYQGRPGPDLGRLRREGVAITTPTRKALLSVTGDTLPEVLDRHPELGDSQVLVMECTFLDDRKPYEACRAGGHTHLKDLLSRADLLRNPHVVLSHFSQIYQWHELPELLAPLQERVAGKVHAFPMRPCDDFSGG